MISRLISSPRPLTRSGGVTPVYFMGLFYFYSFIFLHYFVLLNMVAATSAAPPPPPRPISPDLHLR